MTTKKAEYVSIFDTTLRDGEQTPGVSLTTGEKLEIARQLDRLGVNVIEPGTPVSSEGEKKAVKEVANAGLNAEICALARTLRADIDEAIACDPDAVHTFNYSRTCAISWHRRHSHAGKDPQHLIGAVSAGGSVPRISPGRSRAVLSPLPVRQVPPFSPRWRMPGLSWDP